MTHIEEERLALLLAVIADIDPGGDLLVDDLRNGLFAEPFDLIGIDRLAAGAADIHPGQLGRARQAAGMGGQDALGAPLHGGVPPLD